MSYSFGSVVKGGITFAIAQILTKASGFLLIPIYTRFLTTTDYGIIGYLQVIMQVLSTILMFGFYGAQTRFYYDYKYKPEEMGSFLYSINIYLLVVLFLVCSFFTFYGENVFGPFIDKKSIPFNPYWILILWIVFFQIFNQIVISYYLCRKNFKRCATLQYVNFLITTTCIIYFIVVLREGALGQIKGLLIGNFLFFTLFYWDYAKNFRLKFSFNKLKYALSFGLPVVFHLLASVSLNFIDRVILERYVSLADLGIYTLGYQVGMVMSVLVNSFNQAWAPNYYDLMKDKNLNHSWHVKRVFYIWLGVIGTICLIGSMWSKELLLFLTPAKFHKSAQIVPIIIFSYVINGLYFFAVNPILFFKKTKFLPFTTGTAAILNIMLNFLLIPKYGIMGAAYATVISFMFMAVSVYLISLRLFNPGYNILKVGIVLSCLVISYELLKFHEITLQVELIKSSILVSFVCIIFIFFKKYFLTTSPSLIDNES